jgi:putative tryptophan/tyrosine transport system substrate-binding protein
MRRREFLGVLGAAAAAWPLAARAQQGVSVVGFLTSLGKGDRPNLREAFRRGLSEAGYVEGRNVNIEYRFAENQLARLPALAAELVDRRAAVIAATGGGSSVLAVMAATTTIPIVFTFGGDPVREGFVASLNRPGGNVTGASFFGSALLIGKGLGLLHELVPNAAVIGLLIDPRPPESAQILRDAQAAARTIGRELLVLDASTPGEIDAAFAALRQRRAGALLVSSGTFFTTRRQQIVALAARDAIPAMYSIREYVEEGGLMSYGNDIADGYRRAGLYVARILKGEKPADLPVDQATKFEFVINLKTANALGLEVPPGLSARADEVIE